MKGLKTRLELFKDISIWPIIVAAIAVMYYNFNTKPYMNNNSVIQWDIIDYYAYLPATFIYKDITLKFQETDTSAIKHYVFWAKKQDTGNYCIKMTMGLSIMYAPFFAIAHLYASLDNSVDNGGFSWPYRLSLLYAAWFWLLIGLWYLRMMLLELFSNKIVAITLLAIVFGTNLFYYASREGAMPHVFNFSLIILFLYQTRKWYEKPSIKAALFIGILSGLISLIRPVNVLVGLVFIFYDFNVRRNTKLFLRQYLHILILLLTAFVIWIPQLIYWKIVSGSWLSYSYGDEGFFWNSPHVFDVLFSFRKGLFIYSPVLILSYFGFVFLYKYSKTLFWPIIVFIAIYLYVISCWWAWWYGGSFGMRALIDVFGLLAFPLAFGVGNILKIRCLKLKSITIAFMFMLIFIGIFNTSKYHYGSIHWDSMTKEALFKNYFNLNRKPDFEQWLKAPDNEAAMKGNR